MDIETLRQKYGQAPRMVRRYTLSPDDPAVGSLCLMCRERITQATILPNEYPMTARGVGVDGHAHLACLEYCTRKGINTDGSVRVRRMDVVWWWKGVNYDPIN